MPLSTKFSLICILKAHRSMTDCLLLFTIVVCMADLTDPARSVLKLKPHFMS